MKLEDQNTEYKQSWRDEYLKWICGFANADGGRMFIGIKDDKVGNTIVGVADWKPLLEAIPNLMRDTMGMIADVKHIRKESKDLVEIIVPAYPVPISLRGVYYIRNPTIAGCVYLTGKIETWGRGVRKVFDECKRHGCPPPVYEVSAGDPGDIQVRIDAAPDAIVNEVTSSKIVDPLNDPIKSKPKGPSRGAESGEVIGEVAGTESKGPSQRGRVKGPSQGAESRHKTRFEIVISTLACNGDAMSASQIAKSLGMNTVTGRLKKTFWTLLEDRIIERTEKKINSRLQKYRLTAKGRALAAKKVKPTV